MLLQKKKKKLPNKKGPKKKRKFKYIDTCIYIFCVILHIVHRVLFVCLFFANVKHTKIYVTFLFFKNIYLSRKRDTDVQNRLWDSVGEGEGGMF